MRRPRRHILQHLCENENGISYLGSTSLVCLFRANKRYVFVYERFAAWLSRVKQIGSQRNKRVAAFLVSNVKGEVEWRIVSSRDATVFLLSTETWQHF